MYGYKINNSYTVYVSRAYNNEVSRICNQIRKEKSKLSHRIYRGYSNQDCGTSTVFIPLQNGTEVKNRYYGIGTVVSTNESGYMIVCFNESNKTFKYPDAVKQGYLEIA